VIVPRKDEFGLKLLDPVSEKPVSKTDITD